VGSGLCGQRLRARDESALEVAPPDRRLDRRPTAFTTMRYTDRQPLPFLRFILSFLSASSLSSSLSLFCVTSSSSSSSSSTPPSHYHYIAIIIVVVDVVIIITIISHLYKKMLKCIMEIFKLFIGSLEIREPLYVYTAGHFTLWSSQFF